MPHFSDCPLCSSDKFSVFTVSVRKNFPHFIKVKFKSCGMIYSNPVATQDELNTFYQNYYQKNNFKAQNSIDKSKNLIKKVLSESEEYSVDQFKILSKYKMTGNFLDIGCGLGIYMAYASKIGFNVYGTEYDNACITSIKEILPEARLFNGDLMKAKLPDNHFDFIYFHHVIEHVINPKEYLRQIHRILKPDGILYIATPNISCILYKFYRLSSLLMLRVPSIFDGIEHTMVFNKKTLKRLLEESNFKIIYQSGKASESRLSSILQSNLTKLQKFYRIVYRFFDINQELWASPLKKTTKLK